MCGESAPDPAAPTVRSSGRSSGSARSSGRSGSTAKAKKAADEEKKKKTAEKKAAKENKTVAAKNAVEKKGAKEQCAYLYFGRGKGPGLHFKLGCAEDADLLERRKRSMAQYLPSPLDICVHSVALPRLAAIAPDITIRSLESLWFYLIDQKALQSYGHALRLNVIPLVVRLLFVFLIHSISFACHL